MGKTDSSSTNGALHTHVSTASDSAPAAPEEPSIAEPPDFQSQVVTIEKPLSAHTLPAERVAALLNSNLEDGLSSEEAAARLARDGPNTIKGAKGPSLWEIFLQQVANALTVVLIAVTALSFAISDYIEGGVVAAVIVLNIVVGYVIPVCSRCLCQIALLRANSESSRDDISLFHLLPEIC
jgi:P-type Na+/K+ transporter